MMHQVQFKMVVLGEIKVGVIGEDRGFRSCVEVGTSHECMSGNVFPSKEVCINPSLRH